MNEHRMKMRAAQARRARARKREENLIRDAALLDACSNLDQEALAKNLKKLMGTRARVSQIGSKEVPESPGASALAQMKSQAESFIDRIKLIEGSNELRDLAEEIRIGQDEDLRNQAKRLGETIS